MKILMFLVLMIDTMLRLVSRENKTAKIKMRLALQACWRFANRGSIKQASPDGSTTIESPPDHHACCADR
jgi:hypothetical protein